VCARECLTAAHVDAPPTRVCVGPHHRSSVFIYLATRVYLRRVVFEILCYDVARCFLAVLVTLELRVIGCSIRDAIIM
jgi:hypothetical protein